MVSARGLSTWATWRCPETCMWVERLHKCTKQLKIDFFKHVLVLVCFSRWRSCWPRTITTFGLRRKNWSWKPKVCLTSVKYLSSLLDMFLLNTEVFFNQNSSSCLLTALIYSQQPVLHVRSSVRHYCHSNEANPPTSVQLSSLELTVGLSLNVYKLLWLKINFLMEKITGVFTSRTGRCAL